MKLRTRISLTFVGLVLAGVALVGLLSSLAIQKYIETRTIESLHGRLEVLSQLFARGRLSVDSLGGSDAELGSIARTLNVRLTLIRRDGTVIYDSKVPRDSLRNLENHGNRPEVGAARRGGTGSDRRMSVSVNEEFFYAARMITAAQAGALDSGFVRTALSLNDVNAVDRRVGVIVWGVGLLAGVLTVIVSFQMSRRITRPILSISQTAQAIRDGDLNQRIPVTTHDEIADLARAINEMAEKLGTDIAQLRKLERIRSEFLGNVSHELRTPIFSIQGFIETLLDGAVDDASVNRDFLEKAHRQAARLNALLNDLIEISRIESGDMKMSFRYFDVTEFLESVLEEMREHAARKSITLELLADGTAGDRVFGDRERLKQVMINLVDNAVKYTDSGGKIVCRARHENSRVELSVEDTGCGIPQEHLPRIFERFYRVDRDRSREVGGTGLGLAIVKHIVEAHGSAVNVTSAVGKGTSFSFSLKT